MKKALLNIITLAFVLATVGLLMDGDSKEPSILMRFIEFFLMTGILFMFFSAGYFSIQFLKKTFQKA